MTGKPNPYPWSDPDHDILADLRQYYRDAGNQPYKPFRPLLPTWARDDIEALGLTEHVDFTPGAYDPDADTGNP
jgi:hypothetical protein